MNNPNYKGGDKAVDYLENLGKKIAGAKTVRVGFLENATYPDGTSVPMVAAIQEFGAPRVGIPPRPYFRTMVAQKKGEWGPATAALLKANDYDAKKTLGQVGMGIKGQLQQSIVDLLSPPLSEVTLMLRMMRIGKVNARVTFAMVQEARARVAKGERASGVSTKPLIDSGFLLSRVDFEVA